MRYLYHATSVANICLFEPRNYWHINYEVSGRLYEGQEPPAKSEVMNCFYALPKDRVSFYFLPSHCARLMVSRSKNPDTFARAMSLLNFDAGENLLLLNQADEPAVMAHSFSLYRFAAGRFRRLPNGEYVSHTAVVPLAEKRYNDAIRALRQANYPILFVNDIVDTRSLLLSHGVKVDSEGVAL